MINIIHSIYLNERSNLHYKNVKLTILKIVNILVSKLNLVEKINDTHLINYYIGNFGSKSALLNENIDYWIKHLEEDDSIKCIYSENVLMSTPM